MAAVTTLQDIIQKETKNAFNYEEYTNLMVQLVENKDTTGNSKETELIEYTALNQKRMKRWDKTAKVNATIENTTQHITQTQNWIVITESWCGDAAHILPFIYKAASLNKNIHLKIVLRDEHPELINEFLTNGGQAIPKLIVTNQEHKYITDWGPRPSEATQLVHDFKIAHGKLTPEFKTDLQKWYNKDKGQNILNDLSKLITKSL